MTDPSTPSGGRRPAAALGRRRFLGLAAGSALAASSLAGCGGSGTAPTAAGGTTELDAYTWEGYDLQQESAAWRASEHVDLKAATWVCRTTSPPS